MGRCYRELKKGWCTEYCRNIDNAGNQELIKMGAITIDEAWDGDIMKIDFDVTKVKTINQKTENYDSVQLSLFDNI